jgi:hypothetical protein
LCVDITFFIDKGSSQVSSPMVLDPFVHSV